MTEISSIHLFNLQKMYSRIFTWFILLIGESLESFQIIGKIMNEEFKSLINSVIITENNNQYRFVFLNLLIYNKYHKLITFNLI